MRKLTPELLDHLPHDDPGAMRSRADLRRINRFMGNERWIASEIPENTRHITEIGAGEGHLLSHLAAKHPQAEITAYDLAPRPAHLPLSVKWIQGDLFSQAPPAPGGTLIANLFLHHFTDPQLRELGELGEWMRGFHTLLINEPLRARLPVLLGKLATPFIHPITRHDMRVSIEAGFAPGDLAETLALAQRGFAFRERTDWRGAIRLVCQRRDKAGRLSSHGLADSPLAGFGEQRLQPRDLLRMLPGHIGFLQRIGFQIVKHGGFGLARKRAVGLGRAGDD